MKDKFIKLILAIISVITVLSMLSYQTVFAEESGSIEITETATNTSDKRVVPGVKLGLHKIADVDKTSDTGYQIVDSFKKSGISEKDIVYAESLASLASTLSAYAKENSLKPQSVATSDNNGYLSFTGLADGIYLVRQVNMDDDFKTLGYNFTTDSYIIAIPSLDSDGNEIRNVTCQPKGELKELEKKDTSLTVYKIWKDDNNKKGARPKSINVGLYNGTVLKEKVELNAGNNWMYSWKKLDKDGKWSVKELDVPSGYTATVTSDDQGWKITNTYNPNVPSTTLTPSPSTGKKVTTTGNVKTGDNTKLVGFIVVMAISLAIFIVLLLKRRRDTM